MLEWISQIAQRAADAKPRMAFEQNPDSAETLFEKMTEVEGIRIDYNEELAILTEQEVLENIHQLLELEYSIMHIMYVYKVAFEYDLDTVCHIAKKYNINSNYLPQIDIVRRSKDLQEDLGVYGSR
jgi:hypothetical protein